VRHQISAFKVKKPMRGGIGNSRPQRGGTIQQIRRAERQRRFSTSVVGSLTLRSYGVITVA
jgi:hypothetical protein